MQKTTKLKKLDLLMNRINLLITNNMKSRKNEDQYTTIKSLKNDNLELLAKVRDTLEGDI